MSGEGTHRCQLRVDMQRDGPRVDSEANQGWYRRLSPAHAGPASPPPEALAGPSAGQENLEGYSDSAR